MDKSREKSKSSINIFSVTGKSSISQPNQTNDLRCTIKSERKDLFQRFYNKYMDKIKTEINKKNLPVKNLSVIGNRRFSNKNISKYIREPIHNDFNIRYYENNLEKFSMKNILNGSKNIEFTPIPISKSKEISYKNLQRTAVVMRRIEYQESVSNNARIKTISSSQDKQTNLIQSSSFFVKSNKIISIIIYIQKIWRGVLARKKYTSLLHNTQLDIDENNTRLDFISEYENNKISNPILNSLPDAIDHDYQIAKFAFSRTRYSNSELIFEVRNSFSYFPTKNTQTLQIRLPPQSIDSSCSKIINYKIKATNLPLNNEIDKICLNSITRNEKEDEILIQNDKHSSADFIDKSFVKNRPIDNSQFDIKLRQLNKNQKNNNNEKLSLPMKKFQLSKNYQFKQDYIQTKETQISINCHRIKPNYTISKPLSFYIQNDFEIGSKTTQNDFIIKREDSFFFDSKYIKKENINEHNCYQFNYTKMIPSPQFLEEVCIISKKKKYIINQSIHSINIKRSYERKYKLLDKCKVLDFHLTSPQKKKIVINKEIDFDIFGKCPPNKISIKIQSENNICSIRSQTNIEDIRNQRYVTKENINGFEILKNKQLMTSKELQTSFHYNSTQINWICKSQERAIQTSIHIFEEDLFNIRNFLRMIFSRWISRKSLKIIYQLTHLAYKKSRFTDITLYREQQLNKIIIRPQTFFKVSYIGKLLKYKINILYWRYKKILFKKNKFMFKFCSYRSDILYKTLKTTSKNSNNGDDIRDRSYNNLQTQKYTMPIRKIQCQKSLEIANYYSFERKSSNAKNLSSLNSNQAIAIIFIAKIISKLKRHLILLFIKSLNQIKTDRISKAYLVNFVYKVFKKNLIPYTFTYFRRFHKINLVKELFGKKIKIIILESIINSKSLIILSFTIKIRNSLLLISKYLLKNTFNKIKEYSQFLYIDTKFDMRQSNLINNLTIIKDIFDFKQNNIFNLDKNFLLHNFKFNMYICKKLNLFIKQLTAQRNNLTNINEEKTYLLNENEISIQYSDKIDQITRHLPFDIKCLIDHQNIQSKSYIDTHLLENSGKNKVNKELN